MVRLEEDVEDLRRRVLGGSRDLDQGEWPEARLLDLRKAYPRVNKPALWVLRMGSDRITKAVVLGWWEELEERRMGRRGRRYYIGRDYCEKRG